VGTPTRASPSPPVFEYSPTHMRCSDVSSRGDTTDQAHGITYPTRVCNALSRHNFGLRCAVIVSAGGGLEPCQCPTQERARRAR